MRGSGEGKPDQGVVDAVRGSVQAAQEAFERFFSIGRDPSTRGSRAGFYRCFEEHAPRQAGTELRERIQRVALENRFYGYRRVAAELRWQGVVVNHKRVLRVMREDNLLSLRKRCFVVTTKPFRICSICQRRTFR